MMVNDLLNFSEAEFVPADGKVHAKLLDCLSGGRRCQLSIAGTSWGTRSTGTLGGL